MTQTERPPSWREGGPGNTSCLGGIDGPDISRIERPAQAEILRRGAAHLRLVPPAPPPRPRRIHVRISASDGRFPIGRSRLLRLAERDFERLIEAAERLERAS
jgi:hypothetical protein